MRNDSKSPLEVIRYSGVVTAYGDAVVPEGNIVLLPLEANMKLLCRSNNFVQVSNDGITLGLGDADNLGDEAWVKEQRLPAGDRVCTDKWMLCDDRIASYWTA